MKTQQVKFYVFLWFLFFLLEAATNEYVSQTFKRTPTSSSQTGNLVIIYTGSVISCVLLTLIFREICTYRRMSPQMVLNEASDWDDFDDADENIFYIFQTSLKSSAKFSFYCNNNNINSFVYYTLCDSISNPIL